MDGIVQPGWQGSPVRGGIALDAGDPDRRAESGNESSAALAGASAPRSRLPIGGTRVLL